MAYKATIPIPNETDSGVCTAYYTVRIREADDISWQYLPNQFGSPIMLLNLKDGMDYVAEIRRACCEGAMSDPLTVDITAPALPPLSTPTGFNATPLDGSVRLTWDMPEALPERTHVIERALASDFSGTVTPVYSGGWVSYYDDLGLTNGTHYYYRMKDQAAGYSDSAYVYDDATPLSSD